jgi:hypothetical protein
MPITVKYFRIRLLTLATLIAMAFGLATDRGAAVACQKCVFPNGGICVGCMPTSENGYRSCAPDQSTCSCTVSGGSCSGNVAPIEE